MRADEAGTAGISETTPGFRPSLRPSPGFADWLEATGGSLCFSTYQAGRVFLVSAASGEVHAQQRRIGPAMGLAVNADRLWIASRDQLWRFANTGPRQIEGVAHDAVYVPRWGIITGPCDTHEIVGNVRHRGHRHELAFVNTRFSCIATLDGHANFLPIWKPRFISSLGPEDRCHLNGVCAQDGELAYATACAESDSRQGWRDAKTGGGVLIDIRTDRIVARGLSMPHSPRWHDNHVWLCNSGTAEFGRIDPDDGIFQPIALCAGFARGLAIVGRRWAVIGLSREREDSAVPGLPMGDRFKAREAPASCGLIIVDLATGRTDHVLMIEDSVTELFDVAFIDGVRRPFSTGFSEPELQRDLFNLPPLADFPLAPFTGPHADKVTH